MIHDTVLNNYKDLAQTVVTKAIEDYKEGTSYQRKDAIKFLKSSLCEMYLCNTVDQNTMLYELGID